MSVQSVNRLFEYNKWAWRRVFPSLEALSEADYLAERPFFWQSLHGLTAHSYGAEKVWLQRLEGFSPPELPGASEFASFDEVRAAWVPLWDAWGDFLGSLTNSRFNDFLLYRNIEGTAYELRVDDVLRHVFNHATEHRSQMTPVLAQLGHPTEPLDFGRFAMRESKQT